MSDSTQSDGTTTPPLARRIIGLALVLIFGATALLWVHYGSDVFIQMALNGLALCF
jgi:hypothetical protein